MLQEQKELYFFTKLKFEGELKKISPTCVSPIIAVRQIVKKAIYLYIKDHCSIRVKPIEVFSHEDFQEVSNKIYNEIMNNEL